MDHNNVLLSNSRKLNINFETNKRIHSAAGLSGPKYFTRSSSIRLFLNLLI